MAKEPGAIDELKSALGEWKDVIPTLGNVTETVSRLYDEINQVNKSFTEGRLRATEFSTAISDSVAGVIRVGGDVNEIGDTIIRIAAGARRNLVATTETITELTAASKALGDFDIELIEEIGFFTDNVDEIMNYKTIVKVFNNGKLVKRKLFWMGCDKWLGFNHEMLINEVFKVIN